MNQTDDKRVMICADDPRLIGNLKRILVPYAVEITSCGRECLARVDDYQPDILLLQIILNDMDAFDLLARFRDRSAVSPDVVLFTSVTPRAAAKQMASLRVVATILKSSSPEQLRSQLQPLFDFNLPPLGNPESMVYVTNRPMLATRIEHAIAPLGLLGYWTQELDESKRLFESVKPSVVLFEIELCLGQIVSLMESARKHDSQVKFIAVSLLNDSHLSERLLHSGMLQLLCEPFDDNDLSEAVRIAVESAAFPQPRKDPRSAVLVVEDSADSACAVESLLLELGYSVTVAETAEQAMGLLPDHSYDALLLDLGLPGMSGLELLARIRHGGNRTPCVVVTGSRDQQDHRLLDDLGVEAIFEKPADYARVATAINELLCNS